MVELSAVAICLIGAWTGGTVTVVFLLLHHHEEICCVMWKRKKEDDSSDTKSSSGSIEIRPLPVVDRSDDLFPTYEQRVSMLRGASGQRQS